MIPYQGPREWVLWLHGFFFPSPHWNSFERDIYTIPAVAREKPSLTPAVISFRYHGSRRRAKYAHSIHVKPAHANLFSCRNLSLQREACLHGLQWLPGMLCLYPDVVGQSLIQTYIRSWIPRPLSEWAPMGHCCCRTST